MHALPRMRFLTMGFSIPWSSMMRPRSAPMPLLFGVARTEREPPSIEGLSGMEFEVRMEPSAMMPCMSAPPPREAEEFE